MMGILDKLFGKNANASAAQAAAGPSPVVAAPVEPPPEAAPAEPAPDPAQVWAEELLAAGDYRGLAAINNSTDYSDNSKWNKRDIANQMLIAVGTDAVEGILEELATEGVGKSDLASILVTIGDARAVPLLKKLYDRGEFAAYGLTQQRVGNFLDAHPEVPVEAEMVICAVCGAERPTSETRYYIDQGTKKYFCTESCWPKRGRVVSDAGTATRCKFFSEGMCSAGEGGNLCSYRGDMFEIECFVYSTFG